MRARIGSAIGAGYDLVRSCRSSGRWTALSLLFTLRQGLRRRNLYSYDLSFKQRSILRPIFSIAFHFFPPVILLPLFIFFSPLFRFVSLRTARRRPTRRRRSRIASFEQRGGRESPLVVRETTKTIVCSLLTKRLMLMLIEQQ